MKQPRRWAAWLTACMLAASQVVMPREGAASGPFLDGNPPIVDEGEPDGPPNAAVQVSKDFGSWNITVALEQGRLVIFVRPILSAKTRATTRPTLKVLKLK